MLTKVNKSITYIFKKLGGNLKIDLNLFSRIIKFEEKEFLNFFSKKKFIADIYFIYSYFDNKNDQITYKDFFKFDINCNQESNKTIWISQEKNKNVIN